MLFYLERLGLAALSARHDDGDDSSYIQVWFSRTFYFISTKCTVPVTGLPTSPRLGMYALDVSYSMDA
jgi:hypothetical protein